jgi:iron complex transport system permease protein
MRDRNLTIQTRRFSLRVSKRGLVIIALAALLVFVAVSIFTLIGPFKLTFRQVAEAVIGIGNRDTLLVVRTFRLPRIVESVLAGAMLALSGAVFQAVTRNGLVSPDIIGVNAGAAVVAVFLITTNAVKGDYFLPECAFAGAVGAALFVYFASIRHARISPYRLILVGIAVNAALSSITTFLLVKSASANLNNFESAQLWLLGSVSGATWTTVRTLAIVAALSLTPVIWLARRLEVIQLGDDVATSFGMRVERTRIGLIALASLLAATCVALVGPIGFVAFAAPHIARRLVRSNYISALIASMFIGALMLSSADFIARTIIEPYSLPVGTVTVIVYSPIFLFMLYRANRRGAVL